MARDRAVSAARGIDLARPAGNLNRLARRGFIQPGAATGNPPGALYFECRQAWGRQVAYASQFSTWVGRAHQGKARIKSRLCSIGGFDPDEWDLPPKPKWMRWNTYNRAVEKFDRHEARLRKGPDGRFWRGFLLNKIFVCSQFNKRFRFSRVFQVSSGGKSWIGGVSLVSCSCLPLAVAILPLKVSQSGYSRRIRSSARAAGESKRGHEDLLASAALLRQHP
jgi:hypothetical protein